jgi:hypothetical protein
MLTVKLVIASPYIIGSIRQTWSGAGHRAHPDGEPRPIPIQPSAQIMALCQPFVNNRYLMLLAATKICGTSTTIIGSGEEGDLRTELLIGDGLEYGFVMSD